MTGLGAPIRAMGPPVSGPHNRTPLHAAQPRWDVSRVGALRFLLRRNEKTRPTRSGPALADLITAQTILGEVFYKPCSFGLDGAGSDRLNAPFITEQVPYRLPLLGGMGRDTHRQANPADPTPAPPNHIMTLLRIM